jgi:hypothetical protein
MAKDSIFKGALGWDDWIWWCAIGGAGLLFLLLILCAVVCSQRAKRKGRQEAVEEMQRRQREQMRQDEANRRFVEQQQRTNKPTLNTARTIGSTQTSQASGNVGSMYNNGYSGNNRSLHGSYNQNAAYPSYDNSEVPYRNMTSPHSSQYVPVAKPQTTTLQDRIDALRQANDAPRRESEYLERYSTSSDRAYEPEFFASARGPSKPVQQQVQAVVPNTGRLDAAATQYGMASLLKGRIPANERSGHLSNSQASPGQFDDADSYHDENDGSLSRVSVEF